MTDPKRGITQDGYSPTHIKEGYNPQVPRDAPKTEPKPGAGYQPTNKGDNPPKPPSPPGAE